MSARGLHVLMGGVFVHAYPDQCVRCANRQDKGRDDYSVCVTLGKKICCEKGSQRRKCKSFQPTVQDAR